MPLMSVNQMQSKYPLSKPPQQQQTWQVMFKFYVSNFSKLNFIQPPDTKIRIENIKSQICF